MFFAAVLHDTGKLVSRTHRDFLTDRLNSILKDGPIPPEPEVKKALASEHGPMGDVYLASQDPLYGSLKDVRNAVALHHWKRNKQEALRRYIRSTGIREDKEAKKLCDHIACADRLASTASRRPVPEDIYRFFFPREGRNRETRFAGPVSPFLFLYPPEKHARLCPVYEESDHAASVPQLPEFSELLSDRAVAFTQQLWAAFDCREEAALTRQHGQEQADWEGTAPDVTLSMHSRLCVALACCEESPGLNLFENRLPETALLIIGFPSSEPWIFNVPSEGSLRQIAGRTSAKSEVLYRTVARILRSGRLPFENILLRWTTGAVLLVPRRILAESLSLVKAVPGLAAVAEEPIRYAVTSKPKRNNPQKLQEFTELRLTDAFSAAFERWEKHRYNAAGLPLQDPRPVLDPAVCPYCVESPCGCGYYARLGAVSWRYSFTADRLDRENGVEIVFVEREKDLPETAYFCRVHSPYTAAAFGRNTGGVCLREDYAEHLTSPRTVQILENTTRFLRDVARSSDGAVAMLFLKDLFTAYYLVRTEGIQKFLKALRDEARRCFWLPAEEVLAIDVVRTRPGVPVLNLVQGTVPFPDRPGVRVLGAECSLDRMLEFWDEIPKDMDEYRYLGRPVGRGVPLDAVGAAQLLNYTVNRTDERHAGFIRKSLIKRYIVPSLEQGSPVWPFAECAVTMQLKRRERIDGQEE